jgi:hypothetical protein
VGAAVIHLHLHPTALLTSSTTSYLTTRSFTFALHTKMYPDLLATRNFLHHNDNSTSGNHSCPIENTAGPEIVAFVGNLTFHEFATILSGACAIISTILVAIPIVLHAFNYSNPVQQRQIIRIILLVPWVALFAFLIVWRDDIGDYMVESLDFGCSIALSAFLLLMCDFVLSHRDGFDDLFGQGALSRGAFQGASPPWVKVRRSSHVSDSVG